MLPLLIVDFNIKTNILFNMKIEKYKDNYKGELKLKKFNVILLSIVFFVVSFGVLVAGVNESAVQKTDKPESQAVVITQKEIAEANELIKFIGDSPTSFHVVKNAEDVLQKNGFQQLLLTEKWDIKKGGKYFVSQNGSAFIAFIVGSDTVRNGFKIVGVHADSPDIRIKPNPEMVTEYFLKLNTEVYGGPILNTWFDRPLSIAGRVALKGKDILKPELKLIDINKAIAIIPNLAIHMNKEVNKGVEIKNQKVLLPVFCTVEENFKKEDFLVKLIADTLNVDKTEILDYDLSFYDYQKGSVIGVNNDFIFSGRLDDLEAVFAGVQAVKDAPVTKATNVLACFDNEEVGSRTKQGADSPLLSNVLERIVLAMDGTRSDYLRSISGSFMLSSDAAHSIHPNYTDKCDPTNKPVINKGPAVKVSLAQKYTSDGNSMAVFKELAKKANIPYQVFANNSDMKGGSTIGPISASHLPIKSVDIGVPMLGMHSIKETCGVKDHSYMIKLLEEFYRL